MPFYIQAFEERPIKNNLVVSKDTLIKIKSGNWIPVQSESKLPDEIQFEPNLKILIEKHLMSFDSLIKTDGNSTHIFLVNPNNYDITLRKDTYLGYYYDKNDYRIQAIAKDRQKIIDRSIDNAYAETIDTTAMNAIDTKAMNALDSYKSIDLKIH